MDFHIRPSLRTLSLTGISSDFVVKLTTYHPHYKEIPGMRKCAPFLRPFSQLSSPPVDLPDYVGKFATYHPHYKEKLEMTKSTHNPCPLLPPSHLSSLPGALSDCIVKFATYHPHYKEKLVSNSTRIFVGAARPRLVAKKGEPPRTSLHLLSDALQLLSLMLSLTLSGMHRAMFECLAMPKCMPMSECAPMSECEVSLDLSHTAPTVEFLPDDIAVLDKQLQLQITNNSRGLRYDRDTLQIDFTDSVVELYAMAQVLDIEKRHWGRYQIMQTKSNQHQRYGIGGTGRHETGKDRTGKYKQLATFRKSCQCRDIGSHGNVTREYDALEM